ncbi:MAG: hypothetical protein II458_07725 [Oscillospiraceae bacterium]|nr:hypothetical protein [Oscillospiraceae bacterium]
MDKKHIIAILALALCTALCIAAAANWPRAEASAQTGSADPAPAAPNPTEPTEPDPISDLVLQPGELQPVSLGFGAQYIRTDGYHEDVQYPVVKLIRSVEELNAYYQANRDRYYMDGFRTACEKYDEAYFSDRILVIVVTEAGSGSVRYQVTGAALNGDTLAVDVNVLSPEVGTCDMAEWHILIEPAEGVDVADAEHVTVNLRTMGMVVLPDNDAVRQPITETDAVETAKTVVTVEYDSFRARFDQETSTWQVNFYREGWVGGDQTVTLDEYGTILGSVYGE